ncbi:MAG: phosphomannomutase/phosphoglucomutase [Candidatus Helarchaeota archaeon]|nr:phosphomannomutase/phosphoglucomutase [Candidatus Helarchaeota archaeon]
MNPNIFREYDIRGLVDIDLTDDLVEKIGKGFGTYIKQKGGKKVSVARDVRPSSTRFRDYLIDGILSTGVDVIDLGEVPTPPGYFSFFHYDIDGGIIITASHNPPEYNGFKVGADKTTIYGEEIQAFRRLIESEKFNSGSGKCEVVDIITPYIETLKSKFQFKKELNIAVDAGNGMGGIIGPSLLRELGCKVTELYCEPDGSFPNHHPDPGVDKNLQDLIKTVNEKSLDLGVAFDGDADRIGPIDDLGRIIRGDQLAAVYARDVLKKHGKQKILFDVKCSLGLIEDIENHGGIPFMWKTGHSLLKNKLREEKALFAGEMSGHMFFADDYFGYDDAIYSACRLVQIVSETDLKFSQIIDSLPQYFSTPEMRVKAKEEEKFEIVSKLKEYFKKEYDIIDIDGVRIVFPDGWGLVRASNTQPALVIRFEAKSRDRLEEIKNLVMEKIKEFGEIEFV